MAVKKRTGPDWQDLRVFVALARHGSLSATARALSVNHATIARRIQSLELSLGHKLVERRRDGYALTAAGTRTLAAARDMEAAADALQRAGEDDAPRGLVRVNAPPALAQGFLIPHLASLTADHAGLDIELATDLRVVSLDRHEADVAVRMVRPRDGDVVAKRLAVVDYGFYGTAALGRRVAKGAAPVFVGFDEANADIPEAAWLAEHFPRARVAFRASHHAAQAAAAVAGAGLALLPHYIGRRTAGLRHCDLGALPAGREVWVITRRQGREQMPVRTVVDALVALFARERALFEA